MAKKQKKEEDIPRPKEDVRREKGSFKNDFANFIKNTSSKPKEKPE